MDLNVEGKTMKLFEGNIDLGLDRDFLDMTPKHSPQNTHKKSILFTSSKLKMFVLQKASLRK